MNLNQELVARLRDMAGRSASIRMMVGEIRIHLKTDDGLALVADRYFKEAFRLPLGDVRQIEGASCLGGKVYDDNQIDQLMLPIIAKTRHLWQST